MARLIEIDDVEAVPAELSVSVGDVLRFTASGGRITGGDPDVLRLLGSFRQGIVGPRAEIVSPAGPPTSVVFEAVAAGSATIDVMTGDPFRGSRKRTLEVLVQTMPARSR